MAARPVSILRSMLHRMRFSAVWLSGLSVVRLCFSIKMMKVTLFCRSLRYEGPARPKVACMTGTDVACTPAKALIAS